MSPARLRPLKLLVGLAAGSFLLVATVLFFAAGQTDKSYALPNPNGYDDLLKAGKQVARRLDTIGELNHDTLKALVMTNSEALRLLRAGLSNRCVVPIDAEISNFSALSGDLIGLKALAKLLAAEGRLAELENRPAAAANSYIDAVHLGTEMSRGGLMMNRLVGIACEAIGGTALVKLLPKLNRDDIRTLVAPLETIDDTTVPWLEVVNSENRWARAQFVTYRNPVRFVSDWWQARATRLASQKRHDLASAHIRLLELEMALRSFTCDHGNAPDKLVELVPKYLRRLPLDPFSGQLMVYRPSGTNWMLYSLGPDRVDDGGKPLAKIISGDYLFPFRGTESSRGQVNGDLLYDSEW
jgi:hypothetical protein